VTVAVHALLLTGRPGVGKTTVLRRLAESLRGWRLAGFYTEELRVAGRRVGFRAVTFDGAARTMAHVEHRGPRVGAYGVDLAVVDSLADGTLQPAPVIDAYLVDEIGKMECLSARFVARMRALLDAGRPVVATLAERGAGFVAEVKARRDVEIWTVTPSTRDALPDRARDWLLAHRGSGGPSGGSALPGALAPRTRPP
jgi:nucleoside-triphosphatase